MKKRILASAAIAAAVIGTAICAVGCGSGKGSGGGEYNGDAHSHTAAVEWSYDEYYHFHEADCRVVAHRFDVAEHDGDDCFCGYSNGGDTPDKPNDGASAFGAKLSASGKLTFTKISGASKYVLTVTYPSGSVEDYDIANNKTSVELEGLESGAFPVGKSTLRLVAYETDKINIDGEEVEQDVPMGVDESYRVVKLNGGYSLTALAYSDEYISLDGFTCEDEENNKFVYELALASNSPTSFNISKYAKAASGGTIKFYKTRDGRDAEDASAQYGSIELGAMRAVQGENMYYVRVTKSGETYDYDLCVYGLATVNIKRYDLSYSTADNGVRTYSMTAIGEPITALDRGIVAQETFFGGVDGGKLGRDGKYNVIERGDVIVSAEAADRSYDINIYFYDEQAVVADCEEFTAYSQTFVITEYDNMISLNTRFDAEGTVVVPYIIVGKPVISAAFQGISGVTKVVIPEGATAFVASFQQCMSITDIYLPSTIVDMNEFAFGSNVLMKSIPDNTVIHCAFSASKANGFTFKWNNIAGAGISSTYTTEYNSAYDGPSSPTVPSASVGLNYRLDDGALTVVGFTDKFNGVIPDTARYEGETYEVRAIESLKRSGIIPYFGDLVIGKNINSIAVGAFDAERVNRVNSITVAVGNSAFKVCDGVLYSSDGKRVLLAADGAQYVDDGVESIDKGAFGMDGVVYLKAQTDTTGFNWSAVRITAVTGAYKTVVDDVEYKVFSQGADPYVEASAYLGDGGVVVIKGEVDGVRVNIHADYILKDVDVTELEVPMTLSEGGHRVYALFGTATNDTVTKLTVRGESYSDYCDVLSFVTQFTALTSLDILDNHEYSTSGGVVYKPSQFYAGKDVVYALPSLSGTVTLDSGTASIELGVFKGTAITGIVLPDGLTNIGNEAFRDCRKLTSITIPSSVTNIGYFAFYGCTSLVEVNLPSTTASMYFDYASDNGENKYSGVFSCCAKLKTINFDGTVEQYEAIQNKSKITLSSYVTTVHCTDGDYAVKY